MIIDAPEFNHKLQDNNNQVPQSFYNHIYSLQNDIKYIKKVVLFHL